MKIILGSQSAGRKLMLTEMGLEFETMSAGIDEKTIRRPTPEELTLALANAKADAIIGKLNEPSILLTADSVVRCNGRVLEKPENEQEVRDFFELYRTYPAEVINSVVVVNSMTGNRSSATDISTIWMKPISEDMIQLFLKEGKVFRQAGAFGVLDLLTHDLVEKISGSVDSIVGLPKQLTTQLMSQVM